MPEPTEGPWVAAPVIKGFPQHPGEVRGPHGPVAYVSLAVPIEQRHATVSLLAAGSEMLEALEATISYQERVIRMSPGMVMDPGWIEIIAMVRAAIAKAKGEADA